jgi:hypothetical protein
MGGDLGDRRSVGCEAAVTEGTALDTELLDRVARVLYGARWHAALADDVGVSVRQVQRWLAQLRPIPRDIWPTLDKRLAERRTAIRELRGQLRFFGTRGTSHTRAHKQVASGRYRSADRPNYSLKVSSDLIDPLCCDPNPVRRE